MGESQLLSTQERVTSRRLRQMIEEQAYKCALSGVDLEPGDAGLDHITPIAAGGTNTMDNVQVVHRIVNQMKGTLPQEEFIAWCVRVADHHRRNNGV